MDPSLHHAPEARGKNSTPGDTAGKTEQDFCRSTIGGPAPAHPSADRGLFAQVARTLKPTDTHY